MTTVPGTEEQLRVWRDETPGCKNRIHLNNAGAALQPAVVIEAVQRHIAFEAEQGGYEAADLAESAIADTYVQLASLLHARSHNIAVVASATAGFVQAASAFDFRPGDTIVTSRSDYTSYQIQYLSLSKRFGIRVKRADDLPEGGIDPDAVRQLLRHERVRLVSVSWIPTHSGTVQDVASVGEVCEQHEVPFHVDACQAVGQMPIEVSTLRCDYLSATGRKFLRGPRGTGFLYVSDRALERGDTPLFVDMRGAEWTAPDSFRVDPSARRFEDWESAYALVLGLGAAAKYALEQDVDSVGRRSAALAAHLRERLEEFNGVQVLDRGRRKSAIVTAAFEKLDARAVKAALEANRINSSISLGWYGLLDFEGRGVKSAIRLSPHYYNTIEEIELALGVISSMTS
jgi:selenocysteine lyase/cysteine desulfurase